LSPLLTGEGFFYFMAKTKPNTIRPVLPKKDERPVDVYFNRLDGSHRNPNQPPAALYMRAADAVLGAGHCLGNTVSALKLFKAAITACSTGLRSSSPSVFITRLKLSPILSYTMLLVLFALSYGVSQPASIGNIAGGIPPMIWVGTFTIALAWLGQYIGGKKEGNEASFKDDGLN
jgi:hypothetical protein